LPSPGSVKIVRPSNTNAQISVGMVPVRLLNCSCSSVSEVKLPISEGMVPVKSLFLRRISFRFVILPNSVGIVPVISSFLCNLRLVRAIRPPISVGIDPARAFFTSLILTTLSAALLHVIPT